MIFQDIIKIIIKFIISLVQTILIPIDGTIALFLPDFSNIINYVSSFFQYISNIIPWAVSYLGLDTAILSLVVSYIVFRLTVTLVVHTVKLALAWYNILKIG